MKITLIVIGVGLSMMLVEFLVQARSWPKMAGWWGRAIFLNAFQVGAVFAAGFQDRSNSMMKPYRRAGLAAACLTAATCSLVAAACSRGPASTPTPGLPRIALAAAGDSVVYVDRTHALTVIERPTDTLAVTSDQVAVMHVMRTAPDTLEAFFEHLVLRFSTKTERRDIDTDSLIGRRFVLHDRDGRIETVHAPELPEEIRQLTDLRGQFDDFFLRLPGRPLTVGAEWVDTIRTSGTEGDAARSRTVVARYTVRADTVVHDVPARVIDYRASIEASLRSAPTAEGTLSSSMVGEEEGMFLYSPEREVMLGRHRIGYLEGAIAVDSIAEPLRFPQSYTYENTVELLPPVDPDSVRRHRPAPAAPPVEP